MMIRIDPLPSLAGLAAGFKLSAVEPFAHLSWWLVTAPLWIQAIVLTLVTARTLYRSRSYRWSN